jgi:hypothetical protein
VSLHYYFRVCLSTYNNREDSKPAILLMEPLNEFLTDMELRRDPFLTNFNKCQQTIILSAFGEAVREGRFCKKPGNALVGQTVIMENISQTFRDFDQSAPRHDRNGIVSKILQKQFKGYQNHDPKPKQEKVLQLSILHSMLLVAATLLIGALFFCMLTCKYLKVLGEKDKKTKLICV